ncbi:MAG: AraC family transcriptional regulator [Longicatena sp.]
MQNTNLKMYKKLLYVTHSRYDSNWHSTPHTHGFTELFYVIKGSGQFFIQDTFLNIKEDDLIIINPLVLHTETSKDEQPLEYMVLGIEGLSFINEKNNTLQNDYSIHNYYNYKHEILFYLKSLLSEIKNKEEHSETMLQDLLEILIINMIRRTNTSLEVTTTKKNDKKECILIENYINEHFKEEINLEKLSDITYMNKFYLVHAFKKYKGISPINYLLERRICEAKVLLETTNLRSKDIASILGFSSQSYFTQAFKRQTLCSPQQYRKALNV